MKFFKQNLLIIFVLGIFFPSGIIFAEKIDNFESKVKVNKDASIEVVEKINYDFENIEKHGIFRNIPVSYQTSTGNKSIDLKIEKILLDDKDEVFNTSKSGSNLSVKIGRADVLLKGKHAYTVTYKVNGAINNFKNLDELYWNVTGNWPVRIEKVAASVELWDETPGIGLSCYLGQYGSSEKCPVTLSSVSTVLSGRPLVPGEELTFAYDFPKGSVYQPTRTEIILKLAKDNLILFLPFVVFILMFIIWQKYGRDPEGLPTIIAEYEPPVDMKPTLVGSLVDERPEYRDITAGLVYLAEQGFIKIKRLEKEWFLGSVDYELELLKNDLSNLQKTEQNILKLFFENLALGETKKISSFKKDTTFSIKAKKIIKDLYQEMTDRGYYAKNPVKARIPYMIIPFLLLLFLPGMFALVNIVSLIISAIIVFIIGLLMAKKTKLGAETKDHILGFKEFLSVTEKERLDFHNAPERKPEQFMRFLPYAIAFGVEKKWADQFKNIYIEQPSWYNGNLAANFVAADFVSHMSDFSTSVNTGMSPKGNAASGGYGGASGGFSGGGFGGGGGGSW